MSFYNGTPNVGAFQKARSAVGSFFQDLFSTNQDQPAAEPVYPEGRFNPIPNSYQIGPNDNSLDQVATSLNVPLQQLVDANDGARTLPPIGSFMAIQPQNSTAVGAPVGNYGNVSSFAQSQMGGRGEINPAAAGNNARGAYFTQLEITNVENMLRNGQRPPQVSLIAAAKMINPQTGQPFTEQDFLSDGYVRNGNQYVLPGTPNAGGASAPVVTGIGTGSAEFMGTGFMQKNAANQTEFTKQLRWDPERKRYVQLGTLIKEGRLNVKDPKARVKSSKKGRKVVEAAPVAVAEASNAGDTPSRQLALALGSG